MEAETVLDFAFAFDKNLGLYFQACEVVLINIRILF